MTKSITKKNEMDYLILKERKQRYINYVLSFLLIIFLIISLIYINSKKVNEKEDIAYTNVSNTTSKDDSSFIRFIYDGFNHNNPPSKKKYVISSVSCNNAKGSWDNKKWQLNLSNIVDKVSCSLYFKKNDKSVSNKINKKEKKIIKEVVRYTDNKIDNKEQLNDNEEKEKLVEPIKEEITFDLDKCSENENCNYKIVMDSNKSIKLEPIINGVDNEFEYELLSGDDAIDLYSTGFLASKNVAYKQAYVKVSVKDKKELSVIVKILVEAKLLNTRVYNINRHNNTMNKIEPNTTIQTFINNIMNKSEYVHVYDSNNNEIKNHNQLIGTGMKVKLIMNNEISDELDIVVLGDVDGDGKCMINDYQLTFNHVIRENEIYGLQLLASDVDNNNVVNNKDFELMYKYISNQINTLLI